MSGSVTRSNLIIVLTIALAMVLMILPLPDMLALLRPALVTLVLIYWWMALPTRVGITTAFLTGLIMDVLTGTVLGQNALTLSITAYIVLQFHQRIRVFPLWQQSLIMIPILIFQLTLTLWIRALTDNPMAGWQSWLTPVISAILWPWIYIILRDIRRRFHVS
ncbi:MAG: rod shape-determining protein MreD [bacterium]